MRGQENKTLRHVILFIVVAVSCGWLGRLIDLQVGRDASGSLGQLLWIVAPLVTLVILRSWGGDGWKDAGFQLRLKGNLSLYGVSLLFFPIMTVIIVGLSVSLGWTEVSLSLPAYLAACGIAVLPNFFKNLFEEFAWRGYLTPRLLTLGYHRMFVHIVVGLVWGAWHFPYLFLFVDTSESLSTYLPRMMIGVIVMAILYGEIRFRTKSVWPAVIMHTMGNVCINTLILDKYIVVHPKTAYVAMPSPEGLMAIILTGLAGFWVYKRYNRGNHLENITKK